MIKLFYAKINYNQKSIDSFIRGKIFENEYFAEYTTKQPGYFLRVSKRLTNKHKIATLFIEPQLNLTRSHKDEKYVCKVQFTIIPQQTGKYGFDNARIKLVEITESEFLAELVNFGCQQEKTLELFKEVIA